MMTPPDDAPAVPTTDSPAVVLGELLDALGRQDVPAMARRWTDATTGTLHAADTTLRGRDEVVAFFETVFASLDDLSLEVESLREAGDTAVAQWRLRATVVDASVGGLRATGGEIDVRGVDVQRIEAGVVIHADVYFDALTVLRQLGVVPASGSTVEQAVLGVVNLRSTISDLIPGLGRS